MKIEIETEIDAPRQFVSDIFAVSENKKHWHSDFLSVEQLIGKPNEVGSVAKLKFTKFELVETVTVSDLPNEYAGEYLTEGTCWNTMSNKFIAVGESKTLYQVDVEYRFIGTIVKIMAFVMPWMFRKQVRKSTILFKEFVERRFVESKV